MKLLQKVLAGIAGSVLMLSASASLAADISIPVVPVAPVVVPPAPTGFDWHGPYVGGVAVIEAVPGEGVFFAGGGAQVGFNIVRGNLVFGPLARVGFFVGPNVLAASVSGRAGVLLGASHRVLVYGAAGILFVPAGSAFAVTAGGGVEVGIGERLSVFAETRAVVGGGCCLVMTGLNVHF